MSTSSGSSSPSAIPSCWEFSQLLLEPSMIDILNRTFNDRPSIAALIRHHQFIANMEQQLERLIEQHQQEQRTIYAHMMKDRRFRIGIQPVTIAYRRIIRNTRPQPYQTHPHRTSSARRSTASSSSSSEFPSFYPNRMVRRRTPSTRSSSERSSHYHTPPSTVIDTDTETGRSFSPLNEEDPFWRLRQTARRSTEPGTSHQDDQVRPSPPRNIMEPGSEFNPIIVEDDEDSGATYGSLTDRCRRCNQYGHGLLNCTTSFRSFDRCLTCEWQGKPLLEQFPPHCTHTAFAPSQFTNLRAHGVIIEDELEDGRSD